MIQRETPVHTHVRTLHFLVEFFDTIHAFQIDVRVVSIVVAEEGKDDTEGKHNTNQ